MGPPVLANLLPNASQTLCDILDSSRGLVQPPIRSEIFGRERFAQHGRSLGDTHRAVRATSRTATFFPRLRSNIDMLCKAHRYIELQTSAGYDISPAAEWLLDNFHLIEVQLKEIHEGLPKRYFRSLPILQDEPLAGLPRVYGVAWAFVAHTDGAFDEGLLMHFLAAYQETRELNLSEMWALPTTLRVVLVENLRRLAERVATNKAAREVANLCCDHIETYTIQALDQLLSLLNQRGVGRIFLAQMAQRLQVRKPTANVRYSDLYYDWLNNALPDLAAAQTQQSVDQAADNLSVSNAVTSLRVIGATDWTEIVARTNTLMRLMLTSKIFEAEHTVTRDQTLHRIELLARRSGRSEVLVAQTLLDLMHSAESSDSADAVASHWLWGTGRPTLLRLLGLPRYMTFSWYAVVHAVALPLYLGLLLLSTVSLVAWISQRHGAGLSGFAAHPGLTLLGAVLMMFPASEAVVAVINRLISESTQPQQLARLAFANGIPPEHRVMVVIPGMLTGVASTHELVHRLQLHYLANPENQAQFALLTDWADADAEHLPPDDDLLTSARNKIRELNARYPREVKETGTPPRFIILHRMRLFCETEQRWIGWERKRGKLELLVAALAEGSTSAFLNLGTESCIASDIRYIVTLDSDTQLPPGRLRDLVGVAAHPHNLPRLDASCRKVVSGYAIFQPRVVTPLPAPKDFTLYHWLFAGQCGIDPYSAATSEVYQDLFGEGTFTGKGLLNVRAMHALLSGRLPEDQVLSHDLLEGSITRCAAVTDVTVIEDAPFHADVAAMRVHRWTRGDWQLLPFLLNPLRYRFRVINYWKMFDNLRRSLVAPMSLALVLLALAGAIVSPWVAIALVISAFSSGPLMGALAGFSPSRPNVAKRYFYRRATTDLERVFWGSLWHLGQLLHLALMAVDAIVRALYRMLVSRRHLLQWTTAAASQSQVKTGFVALARQHWSLPVVAMLLLAALLVVGTPSLVPTLLLCLLWAASPVWTWWVSRPCSKRRDAELLLMDHAYLEGIARDTWRFFERCVGADDNHLPPDNLQTSPFDMVAHRTSPTNIGLYLLSVACARQFGWIGTQELLTRLEATLATLLTLQRHRGHFLNWYDTQTRVPLLPMYVSTVDSGNLSGHLLTVAQACLELASKPYDSRVTQRALRTSRQRLAPLVKRRSTLSSARREELRWCLADHRATLLSAQRDAQAQATSRDPQASDAVRRLQALADELTALAWQADFNFLYHRKRNLFHIGYRVSEQELDAGFYDLLASESRLTSLLAIAKGDVPVRHWSSLGRLSYAVGACAGLRSWSGSMFEYLMPNLVLDEPYGSLLRGAGQAALQEQIAFAQLQEVPWGMSESAYADSDNTLAYQYAPQGVPRLALRRTPPDELVVAPYATALAAQLASHDAAVNFAALEKLGARARYGFIEALDFTPARQAGGEVFTSVNTFMSHHQGMSIVALANALLGGPAQRWGMANENIEAVSSLLHERVPREVSMLYAPPPGLTSQTRQRRRAPGVLREVLPGSTALEPTHVLSNGHYSVTLRANGSGWSRWGQTGITRWRDDALRDAYGSFFYLRRHPQQQPVSITYHPAPDPAAQYHATYHADRVCLDAVWADLQTHITVWVSPEDDIEFRQVELRNLTKHPLDIELISAFEVTLSEPRADEAHPAFTNLFVRAEWLDTHQALLLERKPRLPTESGLQAAHFLAESNPQVLVVRLATDRQCWGGRNRGSSQPLAAFVPVPPTSTDSTTRLDTGLDPVCAMAVQLRIAPNAKAQLTFATAASDNSATLRAVIDKYRQHIHIQRASLMSATLMGIRLRALRISGENFVAIQMLTTALVLSLSRPQVNEARFEGAAEVCDRRLLWRFGISGDRPLILVSASEMQGLGLLRSMGQALSLWSWGGIACDLVVVNAEPSSYMMPLHREITALRDRHMADGGAQAGPVATGFYMLRTGELSNDEMSTLRAQAVVRLHADGRPLVTHLREWTDLHEQAYEQRHESSNTVVPLASAAAAIVLAPTGDFVAGTGEFCFEVSANLRPLRPWINVLANPAFGAQLSEAGGGYTWALNSRMNQLTAWSNDPVADPPSEWFLLQDRKTQEVWSLAPNAWGDGSLTYHVAHGQGYSIISHRRGAVEVVASWCVDTQTSVKQVRLEIVNRGHKTLHLRLIGVAEWMMGANRTDRKTVHTSLYRQRLPDSKLTALLCTQRERTAGFGDGTAFFALAGSADESEDWTCDRRECFDARGRLVLPDHFGQRSGDGLDPCAALSSHVVLTAGDSVERSFFLGYAGTPDAARRLAALAATVPSGHRVTEVRTNWDQLLGATTVQTPDPLFDAMVNHWLLYQTVACRLWAKAGFYQAGGATGFRDQLQDAMALAWAAPATLRQQIVLCASRQFAEGDVQHWWHSPLGAGVRTHFSDDLLWLAHATLHYLHATGDAALLEQQVPFIEGAAIAAGAEDAYYTPAVSAQEATIFEHCARAIDRSLPVGVHGLPLMGSGDWNDGMNRVGIEGRGESVWLGWFLYQLVVKFIPFARARGEDARALRWESAAEGWKVALNGPAWDGQWFKRAFFDDGQPLGSHVNAEARIDLIAQAWSVLSKAAPPEYQRLALAAVDENLVEPESGLIKLLDPPFAQAMPSAGYIQAYPPGVRENGGQYSHAGVWALMALAEASQTKIVLEGLNNGDDVYRYFTYLSPAHRAGNPKYGAVYGIEPYVMAGDVYTQPPYVGHGGWSWYTGAAAWMHRAAIESIFGLRQGAQELCFTPCLPSHWHQAELTLKRDGRTMRFILVRDSAVAALKATQRWGAKLLSPGEMLNWQGLESDTCFVIPLLAEAE